MGLTMAAELSYRGIKSILVEENPTTSVLAKAVNVSARTMEHYRRLGLREKIQDASYPRDISFNAAVQTGAVGGSTIWRKKIASWGEIVEGVPGRPYQPFQPGTSVAVPMLCPQSILEPVMKEHLEGSPNVKMYWGWEMTSLTQDHNGVTIRATQSGSQEKVFKAKYVIACDGGSSPTRKQLGIHTYGEFVVARACSTGP